MSYACLFRRATLAVALGLALPSAFAATVVFANYISSSDVMTLYRHPERLWLIMPLMILWLCRVWLLASRGNLNEDPLVFALTDTMSLLLGVAVAGIVLFAI